MSKPNLEISLLSCSGFDDAFVEAVTELLSQMSAGAILQIPGVWESVSEELNNEAIDLLAERSSSTCTPRSRPDGTTLLHDGSNPDCGECAALEELSRGLARVIK